MSFVLMEESLSLTSFLSHYPWKGPYGDTGYSGGVQQRNTSHEKAEKNHERHIARWVNH